MISFQNAGLIDTRCITTIGVSVKESENPIGFFGTGLKYAIAIILRAGGAVTIYRGTEPFVFDTAPAVIRGEEFKIVRMNGAELGFTTHLGAHWKVWQAFREIYCNTQDEGGTCQLGEVAPRRDATTVLVELDEFSECFREIHKYILQAPVVSDGPVIAFHAGASCGIFYRSVLVSKADGHMRFAPNITKKVSLTEDRTLADSFVQILAEAILKSPDAPFIEDWLTSERGSYEHEADLDWTYISPSPTFMDVTRRLLADTSRPLNKSAMTVFRRHEKAPEPVACELMAAERAAIKQAIAFCKDLGYAVDEYPISVVESLSEGILGRADRKTRQIHIARRAIQMGDMTLASTLIEEWAHIKHGFNDTTREMQNWLLDSLVNMGRAYLFERNSNGNRLAA